MQKNHFLKVHEIYIITIIVAACSLLYELMLAQTLSTIMGNTIIRYNITIGLYIAALGLGSITYPKFISSHSKENLSIIELLLSFLGGLGPLIILFFDFLSRKYFSFIYVESINIFNHFYIILIGFLSGIELPFLIRLAKQSQGFSIGRVLFLDYLGSFIAAVIFPLYMMPYYNLFTVAATIALFNTLVAFYLLPKKKTPILTIATIFLLLLYILMIINSNLISTYFIRELYL
jgi:spermidine synthase